MILPNFLIIGAPKSGTTSLYKYLNQHPQIFMSANKEPHFFAYEGWQPDFCGPGDFRAGTNSNSVVQIDDYCALFEQSNGAKAIGEASTMYLYWPGTAKRIAKYIPETKLIAILRHPVDRAYSHYLHLRNDGREWLDDFRVALDVEDDRVAQRYAPAWHYGRVSCYAKQLEPFFNLFSKDQLRIYLYDDFLSMPQETLKDIQDFLGVGAAQSLDLTRRHNTSTVIRKYQWLHKLLVYENPVKASMRRFIPQKLRKSASTYIYKKNIQKSPKLDPETRLELISMFQDDILDLQVLLNRDLSNWLTR